MTLDLTTAALMLPAIPFLMLAFGTRFTVVSELIRKIHDEYAADIDLDDVRAKRMLAEISTLKKRLLMIQINQTLASLSFLANLLTIFALYIDSQYVSKLLFGVVLGLLMLAIILFMIEIGIATKSLNLHLSDLDGND
ncbi:MAG: DUF2721 domain-containing protein [SAR202 cluster bacterium]|nr:hypothetical protein [Chloroflexota bacterium]MQG40118.1 DUF2721 domain-containing protein [SAR202 cluster bacterium]|tara:strand:+ start:124 stop:537 length:414 start_codon:yes stop_codon:yes gene_type:complete